MLGCSLLAGGAQQSSASLHESRVTSHESLSNPAGDAQSESRKSSKVKSVTGKLRRVDGNVLTIVKRGLMDDSFLEVEMDDSTKKTGQVVQGMHVKVKYREVRDPEDKDNVRRIAVEIEARPEFASKDAKKAAKQTQPQ